jgi:hypothetical protein
MTVAVLPRIGPYLLLTLLDLLFFGQLVLHPSQVLYGDHSDLLALHIPAKTFLVESWRETGELPRWCPYEFAGTPFMHDIQVGAFYPPHIVLYLLPAEYVGAVLSWLIVVHILIAGWGMYAYAKSEGLGFIGSLVAALGFMFAGRWMLHLLVGGHYIVIGLAWLPWVLLLLERAIRQGSLLWASAAGVVYALLVLGTQPQWTFYSGIFIAMWTLGTALDRRSLAHTSGSVRPLVRWLLCGAWTVVVAVGLCAVQLLPTIEAAGLSCRSQGVAATSGMRQIVEAVILPFGPVRQSTATSWESQAGLGVLWLAMALLGASVSRGRTRWQAGVCLLLLLFALGGGQLLERAPGFGLFRQPVRMFLIVTLPLALLAGRGTEALVTRAVSLRRSYFCLVGCFLLYGILLGLEWGVLHKDGMFHGDLEFDSELYRLSLVVVSMGALVLLGLSSRGVVWAGALALLLLFELAAISWPLVAVRSVDQIYPSSGCAEFLASKRQEHGRVLDYDRAKMPFTSPLGSGVPLAMLHRLEALRGYSPLDVLRYKEYLLFITDRDHPLRALDGSLTFPVINDFPARNSDLLNLLGTRYILQPTGNEPPAKWYLPLFTDDDPRVYDFVSGGLRALGSYTVYENEKVYPRAFVVSRAAALPERSRVLAALKATDVRRTVLLEDYTPQPEDATAPESFCPATIQDYQPNRVVLSPDGDTPGWLVLTDIWYPGWVCEVDGTPAKIHRANYLFRAVRVPAGRHEVVFRFEPKSYQRGFVISVCSIVVIVGLGLAAALGATRGCRALQNAQSTRRPEGGG